MFKEIPTYLLLTKVGRIISLILLGCIIVIYFFIGSKFFLIEKIEVLNSKLVDERSLSRWNGKNIFLVPVNSLIEKIDEIPEVKSVVVRKELPHRLIVEIQEYIPCAFLRENKKLAVSKEGVVFPFKGEAAETYGYPIVIYEKRNDDENFPIGQIWPGFDKAMGAYVSVKEMVPIDIIKIKEDKEIFLYIRNTKTEIRMSSEDYEKEANYLKILMKELPSKNVEYIDLRFGEDVVVKP